MTKVLDKLNDNKIYNLLKDNRDRAVYVIFILFASIMCITFSFMVPFGQVPDEMTHYELIEMEFGTSGYHEEITGKVWQQGGYSSIPTNPDAKVDESAVDSISSVKFDKKFSLFEFHLNKLCVRHLPAGIGFYLGVALNLPIVVCTHMAELFAAAFYIILGCLAIKITPIKKEIFAFCMLMPEALQQCTSVNYDAVLIPCCMFLFAYILKLYYQEEKIRWRNIVIIGIVSLIIEITKMPYVFIALSILIIPVSKFDLRIGKKDGKNIEVASLVRRFWYIALVLALAMGVLYIYMGRSNPDIKTLVADILSFPEFLGLLRRTYDHFGYYHIQQLVGMFGWLDSVVTSQYILLFVGVMIYLNTCVSEKVENKLNPPRRIWILILAVAAMLMAEIAIQSWTYEYLGWDRLAGVDAYRSYISDLDMILGMQGRYWIPCLPLILVALSGTTKRKKSFAYYLVQVLFYIITAVSVINILKYRYWG